MNTPPEQFNFEFMSDDSNTYNLRLKQDSESAIPTLATTSTYDSANTTTIDYNSSCGSSCDCNCSTSSPE